MTIHNVEPWRKHDCAYGKGESLIWSFTLKAGIGRVDVGCCRLLLIADGCHWLQLVAASCCWLLDDCWLRLVAAGGCWLPLEYCLQAEKSLNNFGILMIWGWDNFAGEKVFEFLQYFDQLRLRQICRRKNLWIFPGFWWFAAKTILQAKTSLNIFEEAMKKFGKNKFLNCLRILRRSDEEIWRRQVLKLF